jgi:hypothetical protein
MVVAALVMMDGIFFDPPWSVAGVVGCAILAAALGIWAYSRARIDASFIRRYGLAALRLTVIGLLAIVLLRPVALQTKDTPDERAQLSVLIDATGSMDTEDIDGASRAAYVTGLLEKNRAVFERELNERYDVEFYTFGDTVRAQSLGALATGIPVGGRKTDVGAALFDVTGRTSERPHAGILLLSDGRENVTSTARQAARMMKAQQVPVWTATIGTSAETKDIYVTARLNQDFLVVDQAATLHATVTQSGFADWYADVSLFREDEFVSRQQVMMRGSNTRVTFPVEEATKGSLRYRIDVKPLDGEADEGNNSRTVFTQVVDEKHKVLYVEARPYWDSKFMLRTLQQDPQLEVTSVFQLGPEKIFAVSSGATKLNDEPDATVRRGVALPRTRRELYAYDCVILGRNVDTLFSAADLRRLQDFVAERGGSLVFARGQAYARSEEDEGLSALEPVTWDQEAIRDIRLGLTEEGKRSPVFSFGGGQPADLILRELPEMVSVTQVKNERALSVVLAKGASGEPDGEIAAIAHQRYGKGKVMSIGATGLWRWAFLPKDLESYDDVYAKFWGQMIRWLIADSDFLPGQDISFNVDRHTYAEGEAVTFVVRTKFVGEDDYEPRIVVTAPDGSERDLVPTVAEDHAELYTASILPDQEGEFRAVLHNNVGTPEQEELRFTVYTDNVENRFVAADPDLMSSIADTTGGEAIAPSEIERLPELLAEFEQLSREEEDPVDVWDRMALFSAIIVLLSLEWFLRRRSGLV